MEEPHMKVRIKYPSKILAWVLAPLMMMVLTLSVSLAQAQDQDEYESYDIVVEIEGMVCPFCSYSVEKNLNKMEVVKQADVSVFNGVAKLILEHDQQVTKEQVTKIVTDAGYKTGKFLKFPGEQVTDESP